MRGPTGAAEPCRVLAKQDKCDPSPNLHHPAACGVTLPCRGGHLWPWWHLVPCVVRCWGRAEHHAAPCPGSLGAWGQLGDRAVRSGAGHGDTAGSPPCPGLGLAKGAQEQPGWGQLGVGTRGGCAHGGGGVQGVCPDTSRRVLAELGSFPPLLSPGCPLRCVCVCVREFFLRLSEISFPLCGQETDFNCLYFLSIFFFK